MSYLHYRKKSWPKKIIVREEEMYANAREFATHANDDGLEGNAYRWSPLISTDQLHGAVRNVASTESGDSYFSADYATANGHQLIFSSNSIYNCTSNLNGRRQDFESTVFTSREESLSDATDASNCEEITIGRSDEQEFHSYANSGANFEAEKEGAYKNIGEIGNRQVLLPGAKTAEAISSEGRESNSEELYCVIRSPEANLKASGDRILVNNTLYHH